MDRPDWAPEGIDIGWPSAARIYDYWLGGTHNFAIDREVARGLASGPSDPARIMQANRAFLHRAVGFLVRQGVRQFLDLGSGIPTLGNVHEVAQKAAPESKVVYVDIDPVAVAHSRHILAGNVKCVAVQGDIRDAEVILSDPAVQGLLDFTQPVAVLAIAVLDFVPDADNPAAAIAKFREVLAPGSFLVISHSTHDHLGPEGRQTGSEVSTLTSTPFRGRPKADVAALFGDFELVDPGIVWQVEWRPERPDDVGDNPERSGAYVGVGFKREDSNQSTNGSSSQAPIQAPIGRDALPVPPQRSIRLGQITIGSVPQYIRGSTNLGLLLARLGGANPDVLARAKRMSKRGMSDDQAKFASLGLVLIATAIIAALSMTIAAIDGLHISPVLAVLIGLFWGVLVLTLDRALVLVLKPRGSKWRQLTLIAPRLLMAALLGLVISAPLTLRIFRDEVDQQLAVDNIARAQEAARLITGSDRQEQLDALRVDIARYEGYLAGDVPITTPEVEVASVEYQQAVADYDAKQAVAVQAKRHWTCELLGVDCDPGRGKRGDGPRAQVLQFEYERRQADADRARSVMQEKQIALAEAHARARDQFPDRVVAAQAEANRALPGLRSQLDSLQAGIQGDLARSNRAAAENLGLLAQLQALSHLGDHNPSARLAHLLVTGLLFLLYLLPIAIKSLSILEPSALYERINSHYGGDVLFEEIQAGIDKALRGPPLVNYDGWVSLTAGDRPGVTLSSAQRCLTLDVPGAFDLTVSIAPDDRGEVSERLIVRDGTDDPEVEFTVEVDSDRATLRRAPVSLRVEAPGGTGVATFAFDLAGDAKDVTPWLWIRVCQASRTLQNVELSIEVAPAAETAAQPTNPSRTRRE